jgi:hypothetical protein
MRGKYQVVLLALFAMSLLIVPTAARAGTNLGMQLSSGSTTDTLCDNNVNFSGCTSNTPDGQPGTLGIITFVGPVGGWNLNSTTGLGPPQTTLPLLLEFNNTSVSTNNGASPITLMLTLTNLTGPLGNLAVLNNMTGNSTVSGTSVTVQTWLSTTNTAFCASSTCSGGSGTLLTNKTYTGLNFGSLLSGAGATGSGPYSVTLAITIDSHGLADTTSFDDFLSVPEPATLSVLGAGLLALGTGLRKKLIRG